MHTDDDKLTELEAEMRPIRRAYLGDDLDALEYREIMAGVAPLRGFAYQESEDRDAGAYDPLEGVRDEPR